MGRIRGRIVLASLAAAMMLAGSSPSAFAIHLYRGTGGGCSEADGAISDDPAGTTPDVAATVVIGHNTYETGVSGFSADGFVNPPTTHIKVGESVRWTWNSAHCHSVTSNAFSSGSTRVFDSGFHYPKTPPESPQVAPGVFDYPILDDTPTLSYTHTFNAVGSYGYFCVHHVSIGMIGTIVVDP